MPEYMTPADPGYANTAETAVRHRRGEKVGGSTITRRLPDATLEVWPGCGHFGPQQDPAACAASILRLAGA